MVDGLQSEYSWERIELTESFAYSTCERDKWTALYNDHKKAREALASGDLDDQVQAIYRQLAKVGFEWHWLDYYTIRASHYSPLAINVIPTAESVSDLRFEGIDISLGLIVRVRAEPSINSELYCDVDLRSNAVTCMTSSKGRDWSSSLNYGTGKDVLLRSISGDRLVLPSRLWDGFFDIVENKHIHGGISIDVICPLIDLYASTRLA